MGISVTVHLHTTVYMRCVSETLIHNQHSSSSQMCSFGLWSGTNHVFMCFNLYIGAQAETVKFLGSMKF